MWRLASIATAVVIAVIVSWGWTSSHYDKGELVRPHYDKGGAHYDSPDAGWNPKFVLPLSSNGVTGVSDLPSSVPAPDVLWMAYDHLTNLGTDGGTFAVESGTAPEIDTPFCPDGDYSDLTDSGDPASKSCLTARTFDAGDVYVGAGLGDAGTGDWSGCVIMRPDRTDPGGIRGVAGCDTNDANNYGWSIRYRNIWGPYANHKTASGNTAEFVYKVVAGNWVIACVSAAAAGNMKFQQNYTDGGTTAMPGGDASSATGLRIGRTYGTGATGIMADIVGLWWWDNVELSDAQKDAFVSYWSGLVSTDGDIPTNVSSDGNFCCWADGKIECWSDDFAVIGCEVQPGLTGAGSEGGYYASQSWTNSFLNSRDLSASWSENGTAIGATSTANSPFRDGVTTVTLVEDDAAGASENIYQAVDITALGTGDKVSLLIAARSDSGTKGLDVRFSESVGGGCGASDTDKEAVAITTSWSTQIFHHTILDGDCTSLTVLVAPVSGAHPADFATAAETGALYGLYQIFLDTEGNTAPAIYIETGSGSTASSGKNVLAFDGTMSALQPGAAAKERYYVDFTPAVSSVFPPTGASNGTLFEAYESGVTTFWVLEVLPTGSPSFRWWETNNSITDATPAFAQGTTGTWMAEADYGLDEYELFKDDVSQGTDTTASAPVTLDSLYIGNTGTGASDATTKGGFIKNVKIERWE